VLGLLLRDTHSSQPTTYAVPAAEAEDCGTKAATIANTIISAHKDFRTVFFIFPLLVC
jgi:hypothetical protein